MENLNKFYRYGLIEAVQPIDIVPKESNPASNSKGLALVIDASI